MTKGWASVPKAVAAALVVSLVATLCVGIASAKTRPSDGWQKGVGPIAHAVEKVRGEHFVRPVHVDFLSDAAFEAKIKSLQGGGSRAPKPSKGQVHLAGGALRATGYSNLTDDQIVNIPQAVQLEGLRALYRFNTHSILARKSDAGVLGDVLLAHELTHALDDQVVDFQSLIENVESPLGAFFLQAVIEGNATNTMRGYLESRSAADQAEFFEQQKGLVAEVGGKLANLPTIVIANSLYPYTLGQWLPAVVRSARGPGAINDLFDNPPESGLEYLDPVNYLTGVRVRDVPTPAKGRGERVKGTSQIGPGNLFFQLSTRIDPAAALAAADASRGGAETVVTRDNLVCVRLAFRGKDEAGVQKIADAFGQWAASMPPGTVDAVTVDKNLVKLKTCDPGAASTAPPTEVTAAMGLPIVRASLEARAIGHGASPQDARCAANVIMNDRASSILAENLGLYDLAPFDLIDSYAANLPAALKTCTP